MRALRVLKPAFWTLVAAPGVYQIVLLLYTVARRFAFPYDLEWMEGGMLNHALRLAHGESIYPPPSVEFIPFLYTPLYPALLALLGKLVGLSYQLGRAVSVVSILGVLALGLVAILRERAPRGPSLAGAALAGGVFAATYPWVEGWYDLVRGDTLFLAAGVGGLLLLRAWADRRPARRSPIAWLDPFWRPHAAAVGALLALTFFIKQTGVLLVASGGAALLVLSWRAVPCYVAAAGLVGGGGCAILNAVTGGWFWIYVFRVHQQHDTHMPRFWQSFANMFLQFKLVTAAVAAGLVAVAAVAVARRKVTAGGFLYWSWLMACGAVIGALGWATQWAHFNAYIPALTLLGIAAGMAVAQLGRLGAILGVLVAVQLVLPSARWKPAPFIPPAADRAAGDALIARLRRIPGDVLVLSHPWYAHLAGKSAFTHRMGIMDVSYQGPGKKPLPPRARDIAGLTQGLREGRFAALVLDDRYEPWEIAGFERTYRQEELLDNKQSPWVVTGAKTRPRVIWTPTRLDAPGPGTKVLFDFERPWAASGFTVTGDAWGDGPERPTPAKQVFGFRGAAYASSNQHGDKGTGTLLSPVFILRGDVVSLRIGGGDRGGTRAELRDAATGQPLRLATGGRDPNLRVVEWETASLRGRPARLALVDEEKGGWGILWVDDVREVGLP